MTSPSPSPSRSPSRVTVFKRCPIVSCTTRYSVTIEEYDEHLIEHYNYCKYGHYEEFEIGDPRWPECMAEKHAERIKVI